MRIEQEHNGEPVNLEITPSESGYQVCLPSGEERQIRARRLPNDVIEVTVVPPDGAAIRAFRVPFARQERGVDLAFGGAGYAFTNPAPRRAGSGKTKVLSGALTAPMVGVVAEVLVTEGQSVEKGQSLVVLGAMKVYVTLSAPFPGTVARLYVRKDDLVAHGVPVVDVAPLNEDVSGDKEAS